MSQETRADILNKKFKVNQIRNAIYHYIEHIEKDLNKSKEEVINILKQMGRKMALTYVNYWKPDYTDTLNLMREVHRGVFKTAAKVRQKDETTISVESRSCPLCKYPRELDVAGHNIIIGFIEAIYEYISKKDPNIPKINGTSMNSRIFGDKLCEYHFKII